MLIIIFKYNKIKLGSTRKILYCNVIIRDDTHLNTLRLLAALSGGTLSDCCGRNIGAPGISWRSLIAISVVPMRSVVNGLMTAGDDIFSSDDGVDDELGHDGVDDADDEELLPPTDEPLLLLVVVAATVVVAVVLLALRSSGWSSDCCWCKWWRWWSARGGDLSPVAAAAAAAATVVSCSLSVAAANSHWFNAFGENGPSAGVVVVDDDDDDVLFSDATAAIAAAAAAVAAGLGKRSSDGVGGGGGGDRSSARNVSVAAGGVDDDRLPGSGSGLSALRLPPLKLPVSDNGSWKTYYNNSYSYIDLTYFTVFGINNNN